MKKSLFILFLITINVQFTFSQTPNIQWQKCLGGTGTEIGWCIEQSAENGYILAGWTSSNNGNVSGNHGQRDFWVVKLDSVGSIIWQRALGGTLFDCAFSVQQTTDGGCIVTGFTESHDGDVSGNYSLSDIWVVKLNSLGGIQWQKTFGGNGHDVAWSIKQTVDGGYIVGGVTDSNDGDVLSSIGNGDIWILKLDISGNIQWQKTLGGTGSDQIRSIQQTTDKGYITAGYSVSNDINVSGNHGITDYWVVKLDSTGNIKWQKSLGGTNNDYADLAEQTSDGGYIVTGFTNSNDGDVSGNHGQQDVWVVKLDSTGNIQWQKTFGGVNYDSSTGIQQTPDGGYIVGGFTLSNDGDISGNHGQADVWVVKLDSTGIMQWQKTFGGTGNDYAECILQTEDGGCVFFGESNSNDGDVSGNNGPSDFWVVKLKGSTITNIKQQEIEKDKIEIYPNPAASQVNFSSKSDVKLFNIIGEKIIEIKDINALDLKDLPAGIYYLMLTDKKEQVIQQSKIIKE